MDLQKGFKRVNGVLFMDKKLKMRFLNVYQNLPLSERKNTILLIEDKEGKKKPISWDIVYIEIDQETEMGEEFLNKLVKLNLI